MKDIAHSAYRLALIGAALAAALAADGAQAQQQDHVANGMRVAEMAGACRIMKQLSEQREKPPEVSGFVLGIFDAEAYRLGLTQHDLHQECAQAAALYAAFAAEPSALDVAQYFGGPLPTPPSRKFLLLDDEPPAAGPAPMLVDQSRRTP
jgi:hypothetical protein